MFVNVKTRFVRDKMPRAKSTGRRLTRDKENRKKRKREQQKERKR